MIISTLLVRLSFMPICSSWPQSLTEIVFLNSTKKCRSVTVLEKGGGGLRRHDHDHRFNVYFLTPFLTLKSHVTSKICSMAIRPKEGTHQTSLWQDIGSASLQSILGRSQNLGNCLMAMMLAFMKLRQKHFPKT